MDRLNNFVVKSKIGNKKILSIGIIIAVVIFITIIINPGDRNSDYQMIKKAIANTNRLSAYQATIQATNEADINGVVNKVELSGVLQLKKDFSKVLFTLNTKGDSQVDPNQNFNVTTTLFTDGKNVYEKMGSKTEKAALSFKEFKDACREYKLYDFSEKDVEKITINNSNDNAKMKTAVVYLNDVDSDILKTHKMQYETMSEEKINQKDILITKAQIIYVIQDDYIISQNIQFSSEYKANGIPLKYGTLAEVNFVEYDKDYDFKLPQVENN